MNFKLGYAVFIRINETEFRNYTPSFWDIENGILEILFHLHGPTSGSDFIRQLRENDVVRISMPRGRNQYDPAVKHYLLFGDETSLGLMVAFQNAFLKNHHLFQIYLELDKQNLALPKLLKLQNCLVFDKETTFKNPHLIEKLPVFEMPDWAKANLVLTGNAKSIQTFRKALKSSTMQGKIIAQAFWVEGKKGL